MNGKVIDSYQDPKRGLVLVVQAENGNVWEYDGCVALNRVVEPSPNPCVEVVEMALSYYAFADDPSMFGAMFGRCGKPTGQGYCQRAAPCTLHPKTDWEWDGRHVVRDH